MVDLSGDESFEAADDLAFGEAFGSSALHVGDGRRVPSHADDHDSVERRVRLAVAAVIESMTAVGLARSCGNRAGAAEHRKGGFGTDPVGVVTCGDQ